jgi:hypothetical protein
VSHQEQLSLPQPTSFQRIGNIAKLETVAESIIIT